MNNIKVNNAVAQEILDILSKELRKKKIGGKPYKELYKLYEEILNDVDVIIHYDEFKLQNYFFNLEKFSKFITRLKYKKIVLKYKRIVLYCIK